MRLGMIVALVMASIGCGAIRVQVMDKRVTAPHELGVDIFNLDRHNLKNAQHEISPAIHETSLAANVLMHAGVSFVEKSAAEYVLSGNVDSTPVDEWLSGGIGPGGMRNPPVHFKYTHYAISLVLVDRQGNVKARANSQVDAMFKEELDDKLKATVRELWSALGSS